MATCPRTSVPAGQPLTFRPAKGVQPHLLAIHASSITCSDFEIDDGEIGVIADRDAALAGDAE